MKHIAQIKLFEQVSPDDFREFTYTLELTDSTTVAEMVIWAKRGSKARDLPEIKILKVEQK